MSLYSALMQVLAPFAAKIKGIQTGYDGTVYPNPGTAVREQIKDLHVMIGDVPGAAIQASAVAYGNSDVGTELTNVKGRLQEVTEPKKNLFDKDNVNSLNAYIDSTTIKSNVNARTVYIPCEPNTTYTVSKTSATKRFSVAYSDALPAVGGTVAGTIAYNINTSITITTGDNAQYLVAWIYLSTADTLMFEQICDMLQIEVGSTATAYEPYKMQAVDEVARKEISDFSKQAVIQSEIIEPSYGAELISSLSAFTAIGSATFANGQWTMPGGSGIKITLQITAWKQYVISIGLVSTTISDSMYAVNPLTVSVGNTSTSIFANTDGNWNIGIIPSQSGNIELSLACSSGLSIVIDSISVKQVTGYTDAVMLINGNEVYFSNYVNNTSTGMNLAIGNGHGQVSKGEANTALGYRAQRYIRTGYRNTALGAYAQTNLKTGCANVAIGDNVQTVTESGMFNVGIGTAVQNKLTLGSWNNAIGNEAQRDITTGCNNTGLGRRAQSYITTGSMNTAIGALAGFSREGHQNGDWATKTSNCQTLVGGESTQATTGTADYLTTLGFRAKGVEKAIAIGANASATGEQSIAIGYGAEATHDNEIVIGREGDSIILCGKKIVFNQDGTVTWEAVT